MLWSMYIKVMQAWRAWHFSHVSIVKGRKEAERPQLCVGVPEGSEHENEQR